MTLRRSGPLVTAVTCALLVTACTGDGTAGGGDGGDAAWPSTDSPVAVDGLVWAAGTEVHLPDGTTIDTGRRPGGYAVGGPGVWFATFDGDDVVPDELPPLRLATPDGVEETSAHPQADSLTATPDGHWLAFIDRLEDGGGAAEAVVVDLTTGEEVVRSQDGLVPDDTSDVDWRDLYEDDPVSMLGIVDGTAYVGALDEVLAYDLATGTARSIDPAGTEIVEEEWFRTLHREPPVWNDDRSWQIPAQGFDALPVLESADGERVTTSTDGPPTTFGLRDLDAPQLEDWVVGGWLDDRTVLGLTPTQDGGEEDWGQPALLTCTVPSGQCELMEGTEGGVTLPADRPFGLPREETVDRR